MPISEKLLSGFGYQFLTAAVRPAITAQAHSLTVFAQMDHEEVLGWTSV